MFLKALRIGAIALFTAGVALSQTGNPYSFWCDYHSTYFYKKTQEYPSGKCYDVYEHTFYDSECRCTRTHRATMACARSSK